MTLKRRIRDAAAQVAFRFAADPAGAENMRAVWGGTAYDAASVEAEFGPDAAQAWTDASDARQRFFAAMREREV